MDRTLDKALLAIAEKYSEHRKIHVSLGMTLEKFGQLEWQKLYGIPMSQSSLDRLCVLAERRDAGAAATSVVSHTDGVLSRTALARATLSRMCSAWAVHTNGLEY